MSVGLEDAIGFQLFLLKSNGWINDGKRHSRTILPGSELTAYLKRIADSGKACVDAGDEGAPYFKDVADKGGYLKLFGSSDGKDPDSPIAIVPEKLEILLFPDPRRSYVTLVNNPLGMLPKEEFENEVHMPVLFYPINDCEDEPSRCFYEWLKKHLEEFEDVLKRQYPLGRSRKTSFYEERGYARFSLTFNACRREGRRQDLIANWLYDAVPFQFFVSAKNDKDQITYNIDVLFPKSVSLPKET